MSAPRDQRICAQHVRLDTKPGRLMSKPILPIELERSFRIDPQVEEFLPPKIPKSAAQYLPPSQIKYSANPGKRIFVKLDAEGAEYEILEAWSRASCLSQVDVLMLEWHVVPNRTLEEIRGCLSSAGMNWFERVHPTEPVGFVTAWRG